MESLSYYGAIIRSWAAANPEVHRAWVSGSYATGKAHPQSDLDVAIDVSPEATAKDGIITFWFRHHTRLLQSLQETVVTPSVQLELYQRHHGSIVYNAINSAGIKPVYRRRRSATTNVRAPA